MLDTHTKYYIPPNFFLLAVPAAAPEFMPFDGHSYLVAQGWTGKGTGLRQGAITRPLAIPQKKTLAGLGKDRDEAFPFWDHIFSAAAKSIQLKVDSDEDDNESDSVSSIPVLRRTTTGILSNRRPVTGTPTSGTSTTDTDNQLYRSSLLSSAKREAAKRGLYARFFRGPVVGPDDCDNSDHNAITAKEALPPTIATTDGAEVKAAGEKLKKKGMGEGDDGERRRRKKEKEKQRSDEKSDRKANRKDRGHSLSADDLEIFEEREKTRQKREGVDGDCLGKRKVKVGQRLTESDENEGQEVEITHGQRRKKRKRNSGDGLDAELGIEGSKRKRRRKNVTS